MIKREKLLGGAKGEKETRQAKINTVAAELSIKSVQPFFPACVICWNCT